MLGEITFVLTEGLDHTLYRNTILGRNDSDQNLHSLLLPTVGERRPLENLLVLCPKLDRDLCLTRCYLLSCHHILVLPNRGILASFRHSLEITKSLDKSGRRSHYSSSHCYGNHSRHNRLCSSHNTCLESKNASPPKGWACLHLWCRSPVSVMTSLPSDITLI